MANVTKDLKNGNRYTQLSAKLESDIDQRGWSKAMERILLCEHTHTVRSSSVFRNKKEIIKKTRIVIPPNI